MKNVAIGGLCLGFALALCSPVATPEPSPASPNAIAPSLPSPPEELAVAADVQKLVEGNNQFAFDLYRRLARKKGNVLFSPYSISCALGMTYAGARGQTAEQMAKALHLTAKDGRVHAAFGQLVGSLQHHNKRGSCHFDVSNSLWGQKGLPFANAFVELIKREYCASFNELDFRANPEEARQIINHWIEQKTNAKIKELLRPGSVNDQTRFLLTNAVYFKGHWLVPFEQKHTKEERFLADFKKWVHVPTMRQTLITGYGSSNGCQVVVIPYAGRRFSLCVLMAESENALHAAESGLNTHFVDQTLGRLANHIVDLSVPKARLTHEAVLNEPLQQLGISLVFTPNADLSGIAGMRERLSLGPVIHKSYIDLSEDGTEAAAATGVVGITPIALPRPIPRVKMVLDRPFLFFVRDNETTAVIFAGRVVNPRD